MRSRVNCHTPSLSSCRARLCHGQDTLLPIPSALLSDSLLLGSITKAVLAPSGSMQSVFVHPFVIGGWCGLVATALNCLPVGALDGGRIMQVRLPGAYRLLLSCTSGRLAADLLCPHTDTPL